MASSNEKPSRPSIGIAALIAALALAACTAPTSETTPDPAPAPANNEDQVEAVETKPTSCNALSVDGVVAGTVEASTDAPPESAGGDLSDGTYVFVKAVMYGMTETVAPESFLRSKIVVQGGVVQTVQQPTDGEIDEAPLGSTAKYAVNGTSLTIETSCPSGVSDERASFSVVDEQGKTWLVIHRSSEGLVVGSFYAKQ